VAEPGPVAPVGLAPLSAEGSPLRPARAALAAVAVGAAAWVATGPWVALAVVAVAAVALALPRGQVVLRAACLGSLGAAAAFIVVKQALNGYVVDFDWMNKFETTHAWGLAAAVLLAVDPLVEHLRTRPAPTPGSVAQDGTEGG
jgi:hypothetical protein